MDFSAMEYSELGPSGFDGSEPGQLSEPPREPRAAYRQDVQVPLESRRSGYAAEPPRFGFARQGTKNRKGLLGLSNLGNTCFMNAALQCLTHTHGLQKYFRFCSHVYTSKSQSSRQKLLMSFAHWFERDWGKHISAQFHSPEDILRAVQQLNPTFQGYAQQDSQEFLRCVLDNMHEELRREVPDDLHSHLMRSFGIPAHGEASSSSSSAPAEGAAARDREDGRQVRAQAFAAPTRQFMLCQSTEGVTDAGEIRLSQEGAVPVMLRAESTDDAQDRGTACALSPSWSPCRGASLQGWEGRGPDGRDGRDSCEPSPTEASSVASSSPPSKKDAKDAKEGEAAATHFASIVSELFQGRVVSMVRCLECNKTSRTLEVIYDVSVPIPNANEPANGQGLIGGDMLSGSLQHQNSGQKGATWSGVMGGLSGKVKSWFYDKGVEVTDCLRKYCAPELLSGKDKYFCEHCKRKNDGEKRIALKDLPEVLCIHIKRFRYEASWFNGTKNSRVVTFPVTRPLDLSSFLDEPTSQPVEYRLIGVIQHIGSMGGGHYIAYCQHKRKPQEWYEFDDLQVSSVSPEQVERAEPYVLFYQRIPSKGNKLDRHTFKTEQRRLQAQVRTYLISHPPSPLGSSKAAPDNSEAANSFSSQAAAQAATDEIRLHGPALQHLYKNPPSELDLAFVSKHWYVRLTTMSQPGPLDNHEYLCPHRLLGSHSVQIASEPFIPISRSLFKSLQQKYGGGPLISSLDICPKCQVHLQSYNSRKQAEFDLVSKYDTKDTGDGQSWYLVDALWVNKWKRYVRAEHVTDIRDMCAPGPVTNARLFEKDNLCKVRDNLRLRIDYIGVNARVWWLFMHVHGGGPAICREELEIYSAEREPETELQLEELRGEGALDFAKRVSWQFVDECLGDMQQYERLHGQRPGTVRETEAKASPPAEAPQGRGARRPEARAAPAEARTAEPEASPKPLPLDHASEPGQPDRETGPAMHLPGEAPAS